MGANLSAQQIDNIVSEVEKRYVGKHGVLDKHVQYYKKIIKYYINNINQPNIDYFSATKSEVDLKIFHDDREIIHDTGAIIFTDALVVGKMLRNMDATGSIKDSITRINTLIAKVCLLGMFPDKYNYYNDLLKVLTELPGDIYNYGHIYENLENYFNNNQKCNLHLNWVIEYFIPRAIKKYGDNAVLLFNDSKCNTVIINPRPCTMNEFVTMASKYTNLDTGTLGQLYLTGKNIGPDKFLVKDLDIKFIEYLEYEEKWREFAMVLYSKTPEFKYLCYKKIYQLHRNNKTAPRVELSMKYLFDDVMFLTVGHEMKELVHEFKVFKY
jgi:hypothetical protein